MIDGYELGEVQSGKVLYWPLVKRKGKERGVGSTHECNHSRKILFFTQQKVVCEST